MSDMKSKLTEEFEKIFGYEPGDSYMPRIRNACAIMCQGRYTRSDIIEIVDTSISSEGKSGLVITTEAICVKDSANSSTKFIARFEDIEYTNYNEERFLGMDISALELHMCSGIVYRISLDAINKRKLMKFIDYAIEAYSSGNIYEEDDGFEW